MAGPTWDGDVLKDGEVSIGSKSLSGEKGFAI